MGRIITDERRAQIAAARAEKPDALGPQLAELMLMGNVPVEIVATLLSVSEPTVYRWMYGFSEPRDTDKITKINKLMTIIRKAKRAKDLPLTGTTRTRVDAFIELVAKHKNPAPPPA
jgi:hypothetical protein